VKHSRYENTLLLADHHEIQRPALVDVFWLAENLWSPFQNLQEPNANKQHNISRWREAGNPELFKRARRRGLHPRRLFSNIPVNCESKPSSSPIVIL